MKTGACFAGAGLSEWPWPAFPRGGQWGGGAPRDAADLFPEAALAWREALAANRTLRTIVLGPRPMD